MKKNSLFAVLSAAVLSVFAVSCKTADQEGKPPFVTIDKKNAVAMVSQPASAEVFASVEAGKIYVASDLADRFSLMTPPVCRFNEEGLLTVRVNAQTAELGFWHWLFFPEDKDNLAFRFVWFDGNKKYLGASQINFRDTMPSDPVRFSTIAPMESCKNFSFIVCFKNSTCVEAAAPQSAAPSVSEKKAAPAESSDSPKPENMKAAAPAPKAEIKQNEASMTSASTVAPKAAAPAPAPKAAAPAPAPKTSAPAPAPKAAAPAPAPKAAAPAPAPKAAAPAPAPKAAAPAPAPKAAASASAPAPAPKTAEPVQK